MRASEAVVGAMCRSKTIMSMSLSLNLPPCSTLAKEYGEERFARMARVMRTSMLQLMPTAENHCNIGRAGYYPEVVQHTTWDYGHNGKGFYNDIFAPGWTVASLWQLLTPERVDDFFNR